MTVRTLLAVLLAVAAGSLATRWRPRRLIVEGPSMEPTLSAGDRLLVVPRRRYRVGDIVALGDPRFGGVPGGRLLVKRVLCLAGHEIVVAGDNPGSSTDSRDFGPVDRRAVVGRAVYRYGRPERSGPLP